MITIRKLEGLKTGTRRRKIIRLLEDAERGNLPEGNYWKSLLQLAVQSFPEAKIEFDLLLDREAPGALRRIQNLRCRLSEILGEAPADWDFSAESPVSEGWILPEMRRRSLYLEDLRAPYNVGSIFRSAESFGVGCIDLSPDCVSPLHLRARRSSMGTTDLLPFRTKSLDELESSSREGVPVFALELGGTPYHKFSFPKGGEMIVGSEELGVSPRALSLARDSAGIVSIPLWGRKGSLNVSVAVGIVLSAWINGD